MRAMVAALAGILVGLWFMTGASRSTEAAKSSRAMTTIERIGAAMGRHRGPDETRRD
jgi:hypothetical protein